MTEKSTGRPPSDEPRVKYLKTYYSKTEYEKVRAAAKAKGLPMAVLSRIGTMKEAGE